MTLCECSCILTAEVNFKLYCPYSILGNIKYTDKWKSCQRQFKKSYKTKGVNISILITGKDDACYVTSPCVTYVVMFTYVTYVILIYVTHVTLVTLVTSKCY